MPVKLRFLGSLSIIAGSKVIEVNLNDGDTVLTVIERVAKSYSKMELMKRIFHKKDRHNNRNRWSYGKRDSYNRTKNRL